VTDRDRLRLITLGGLAGSVLMLLGSLGSGALPVYDPVRRVPVLTLLRQGAGERVALTLVYVGLAVLGMCWLYLGRAIRHRLSGTEEPRLLRIGALWALPLLFSVPLFSRDLYSYAAQAQITHAGLDPYTVGPASLPGPFLDEIDRMWVDSPAPYGPLWLTLGRLAATATRDHVVITVFCMRLLSVAGVLLMARYLPRLAVAHGVDPRGALWLGLLNPLVLAHFVAGGHNDALMLGLLVAGVTIALEATDLRWVVIGVAVTSAAVLVKAPAVLAVGFLAPVWTRHLTGRFRLPRASAGVGLTALLTATVITLASGLGFGWVKQLNTPGAVVTWLSAPTGLGLLTDWLRGAHNFVTSEDPVISAFRIGGQAVTLVIVFVLWLRARRIGVVAGLALALLTLVMLGPVVQPWYVVWPLALAAVVRLPHRLWLLAAGASVWLSLMITPQGENLFLEYSPSLATGLAGAVAAYAVLGHQHARRPARLGPVVGTAMAAGAAAAAGMVGAVAGSGPAVAVTTAVAAGAATAVPTLVPPDPDPAPAGAEPAGEPPTRADLTRPEPPDDLPPDDLLADDLLAGDLLAGDLLAGGPAVAKGVVIGNPPARTAVDGVTPAVRTAVGGAPVDGATADQAG
jgi:alpha-1,6-mannosyltransferase